MYNGSKKGSLYGYKKGNHRFHAIPDYLNDLNAMASAEKTVPYELQPLLLRELKRTVMNYSDGVSDWDVYTATAAQRADAFLLATGRAEL